MLKLERRSLKETILREDGRTKTCRVLQTIYSSSLKVEEAKTYFVD